MQMASPLFNIFNQQSQPMQNGKNMLQQFLEFKNSFSGDPKAEVEKLLQSGRMSQAQYQQLSQMASQLMGILK